MEPRTRPDRRRLSASATTRPARPAPRAGELPRPRARSHAQRTRRTSDGVYHAKPRPTLTAAGVGLGVTAATTLAMLLDSAVTGGAHLFSAFCFVGVSLAGAVLVRPRDLLVAAFAPPLAFAFGLFAAVLTGALAQAGNGTVGTLTTIVFQLALHPHPLFVGTGLACAVALVRKLSTR